MFRNPRAEPYRRLPATPGGLCPFYPLQSKGYSPRGNFTGTSLIEVNTCEICHYSERREASGRLIVNHFHTVDYSNYMAKLNKETGEVLSYVVKKSPDSP